MSNIGKQRILIPKNVSLKCIGWKVSAIGKYGTISITFPAHTKLQVKDNYLSVVGSSIDPSLYGSLQVKLKALIHGLSLPYVKNVQFVGVGYKGRIENDLIVMRLGFSHEVCIHIPKDLNVTLVKKDIFRIVGSNLENVSQFAYKLRSFRPPEPFKGKGIVCLGESVRRKEGKKKKI